MLRATAVVVATLSVIACSGEDSEAPECVSACGSRECGVDACGRSCGTCATGAACSAQGVCVSTAPASPCPTGYECGMTGYPYFSRCTCQTICNYPTSCGDVCSLAIANDGWFTSAEECTTQCRIQFQGLENVQCATKCATACYQTTWLRCADYGTVTSAGCDLGGEVVACACR